MKRHAFARKSEGSPSSGYIFGVNSRVRFQCMVFVLYVLLRREWFSFSMTRAVRDLFNCIKAGGRLHARKQTCHKLVPTTCCQIVFTLLVDNLLQG